ncbi:hypothetical protein AWB70_07587 [Caballeronia cordobensis]|uniref:Uncharacterized protein n=1 Tax=Caballeronia cordobensis TaxID=1353886 RepID=A0A158JXG5_CABCO|nr:hypothetical protein AWB70_07587 [Caballeronia cordobensis]
MTAEGEEVIEDAHAFETKHAREAFSKRMFERRARCDIGGEILPLRIGQGTAIELAVRCERQCIEHDERRGNHVVGQSRVQMLTKIACIRNQRDISDELLILRRLMPRPCNHHSLAHRGMTRDLRFDLTQLDTEPANLDLMIVTAKKLDISIGSIARDISGAIHTRAGNERIIDKPLSSEIRPIQITPRHTRPTDIQLTNRTRRHEPVLRIEQIHTRVGDRTTDRNRC